MKQILIFETNEYNELPRKGYRHSEETKKKMSESRKGENNSFYGKTHSEETREKIRQSRLGKKASNTTKIKLSLIHIGKKLSDETKKKISLIHVGKKLSDEHKEKLRQANLGKHHSEETINKMKQSHIGKHFGNNKKMRGENHPLWKGNDASYYAFHVWIRNNIKIPKRCPICNRNKKLELANITGIYNRDIRNYDWLCHSCHVTFDKLDINKKCMICGLKQLYYVLNLVTDLVCRRCYYLTNYYDKKMDDSN